MKKTILALLIAAALSACSNQSYKEDYTTKPTFCYQLAPQDQAPGKNCIGSGGHK